MNRCCPINRNVRCTCMAWELRCPLLKSGITALKHFTYGHNHIPGSHARVTCQGHMPGSHARATPGLCQGYAGVTPRSHFSHGRHLWTQSHHCLHHGPLGLALHSHRKLHLAHQGGQSLAPQEVAVSHYPLHLHHCQLRQPH